MTTLVSWNVNGIRAAAKKGLLEWMAGGNFDVICLQETKAQPDQLTEDLLQVPGYTAYWRSAEKKGYSGVVTYTRQRPIFEAPLGDEQFDSEGRAQILEFPGFVLLNAYFPNSQAAGARLEYKVDFCETLQKKCDGIVASGSHVVVCGDFNVAHKPIDLTNPNANQENPGYLPEERAWMDRFIEAGYVDTFRLFNDQPGQYTWWSYRFAARAKNIGWRIDYHCVDRGLVPAIRGARIHQDVMGSDHCPVSLTVDV